ARAFARAKMEAAGESDMMRSRHLAHYRTRVEAAHLSFETRDWPQHRNWLEGNYANVRAALGWALEDNADVGSGAAIVVALDRYWLEFCQPSEAAMWPALAYLHLEQLDPRTQARLLALLAGYCVNTLAQYDKAEGYAARCVAIAAQTEGAQIEWVRGWNVLGVARVYQNAV